jgi:hypothetical protein
VPKNEAVNSRHQEIGSLALQAPLSDLGMQWFVDLMKPDKVPSGLLISSLATCSLKGCTGSSHVLLDW